MSQGAHQHMYVATEECKSLVLCVQEGTVQYRDREDGRVVRTVSVYVHGSLDFSTHFDHTLISEAPPMITRKLENNKHS